MAKSEIIPFGKYKGRPVEALAQDREYCEWLMEQEWFRVKYQPIYTVIINHFGEPEETPEHNQLQALFTDSEFSKRFVWHLRRERIYEEFPRRREEYLEWIRPELKEEKRRLEYKLVHADQERVDRLQKELKQMEEMSAPDLQVDVSFESQGIDVMLIYSLFHSTRGGGGVLHVECKPSLGDDYPAVLRQIAASYEFGRWNVANVLLVGQGGYTGTGATLDQVRAIFKSRKVDIVFLADLERAR